MVLVCDNISFHLRNWPLLFLVNRGMGDTFRMWYSQISCLRSLLPSNTSVVALIATATQYVKERIVTVFQMSPIKSVCKSANRPNLHYSVETVSSDIHTAFKWLISELKSERASLPKTIEFCRSINRCASLYKMFLTEMKEESYEPHTSKPSITAGLFAMYHPRVGDDKKERIMQSMLNPSGNCRICFSTTAVGMGVDAPNIRIVIDFGPPADVDDYFQESGRAGRDGIESNVLFYYYPGCLIGHVSRNMKDYCKSTDQCRRVQLLQHFVGGIDTTTVGNVSHNCCDVRTRECMCRVPCPFIAQHSQLPEKSEESADNEINRVVTQEQKEELRVGLVKFREGVICMARVKICLRMWALISFVDYHLNQ